MTPEERTDEALATLQRASIDPPSTLVERTAGQAHRELAVAVRGDWLDVAIRAWTSVGLPAALTITVVGYLAWAMSSTTALYR